MEISKAISRTHDPMSKVFIFNGSSIKEFKAKISVQCGINLIDLKFPKEPVIIGFDPRDLDPKTVWRSMPSEYHRIIFTKNELEYDLTENPMAVRHEIDNQENHPDRDRYPVILSYDPMVRILNAKPGDVIKIADSRDKYYYRIVSCYF